MNFGIMRSERLAHGTGQHFGTDDRIIFGERLIAFDLDFILGVRAMEWKNNASSTEETSA